MQAQRVSGHDDPGPDFEEALKIQADRTNPLASFSREPRIIVPARKTHTQLPHSRPHRRHRPQSRERL